MSIQVRREASSFKFDMQLIGTFLSFASRGDRVGLNQMLRQGISPNVQDYDSRTALHLAASEGHASIVELLLQYKADVNLKDRWQRTPLTDARLYGHRDICKILEVNGGKDTIDDHDQPMIGNEIIVRSGEQSSDVLEFLLGQFGMPFQVLSVPLGRQTVRHEEDTNEVNIDISELNFQQSSTIKQGVFGASEKVKWRGTLVVKTIIERRIYHPVKMVLSATDNSLLRELRHPNILQFLGSIVQGEEMILITEYLSKGNLDDILAKKIRLDLQTALRYALDIARGMNYLHQHKPFPIVHNHLDPRNLLQDEGGHLKVGEYWVQMLYRQIHPNQESRHRTDKSGIISCSLIDTTKDIHSFGFIFYQMLEGRQGTDQNFDLIHLNSIDYVPKFHPNRCPARIQQSLGYADPQSEAAGSERKEGDCSNPDDEEREKLIEHCSSKDPSERPPFENIITILEEVSSCLGKVACPVC